MSRAAGKWSGAFPTLEREGLGLVDVGARDGLLRVFDDIAPLVRAVGFEPDAGECRRLNELARAGTPYASETYLPYGLGRADGQTVLHVCRSRGASSFYRPNRAWLDRFPEPARFDVVETPSVPVRSLDSLLEEPAATLPAAIDFLKVDTQGSGLDVLRGAEQTLRRHVVAVEIEVEFAKLYEAQPLFRDVDGFLSACGFSIVKLRRAGWVRQTCTARPHVSAGQLVSGDALYLRDPLDRDHQPGGGLTTHQLEALMLIAILYDAPDVALELLADPEAASRLDGERIRQYIEWRNRRTEWSAALLTFMAQCVRGRTKAGLRYLDARRRRRSWAWMDSEHDFYTLRFALHR